MKTGYTMKNKIKKIKEIVFTCAQPFNIEIVSVQFVKEGGMRILRVIARKDSVLTVEHLAELNRIISAELDKYDFIDEQYYLEVSSEGLERELKTDIDIKNSIGEYICIRGYRKIADKKEIYGTLVDFSNDVLIVDCEQNNKISINKKDISKIRLAVKL